MILLFSVLERIRCMMIQGDFCLATEICVTAWMWTVLDVIFHVPDVAQRSVEEIVDATDVGCMITLK